MIVIKVKIQWRPQTGGGACAPGLSLGDCVPEWGRRSWAAAVARLREEQHEAADRTGPRRPQRHYDRQKRQCGNVQTQPETKKEA